MENMKLRYIGRDGYNGLRYGKVYNCTVFEQDGYIWIEWPLNFWSKRTGMRPYASNYDVSKCWEGV